MNDHDLAAAARACTDRRGLTRLLARLGLEPPLAAAPRYALPFRARAFELSRGSLLVTVFEVRTAADDVLCRRALAVLRATHVTRHHLVILAEPRYRRIVFAMHGDGDALHRVAFVPAELHGSDIDVLLELTIAPTDNGTAAALRLERALDRRRVSDRFFRDISACRTTLARAWRGIPAQAVADREALALLLLSRLMFLCFLQRRGLLAGNATFLIDLLRQRPPAARTLYRSSLRTLFFGVLNRRPERRTAAALALGDLPYLNGGLFEEHALEQRRPELDLPDRALHHAIRDVLDRYRFTTGESDEAGLAGAIDPEMLSRIFEGLMPGDRRTRTGSYYTPAAVVKRLVRHTLSSHLADDVVDERAVDALLDGQQVSADVATRVHESVARLKILDPACGSGAFLLGALDAVAALRRTTCPDADPDESLRQRVVAESLHGVDLLGDAALICSLRLWLALAPACDRAADVPPLPNLDRHIRQGDALIDPLAFTATGGRADLPWVHRVRMKRVTTALAPLAQAYVMAGPEQKPPLRRQLARQEMQLARCWTRALHEQLEAEQRELVARAGDVDLFGAPAAHARAAEARLRAVRTQRSQLDTLLGDLRDLRQLPFFSFRVHFPHVTDGFDVVLMNPPWVRSHHWPVATRQLLRDSYAVCATAGWPYAAALTGATGGAGAQVDLALLFIERALRLLAPDGTLGTLAPAKLFRSLYAGAARALLLEQTQLRQLEDHSLDHHSVFSADAFAAVVIAKRTPAPDPDACVDITMARRGGEQLRFRTRTRDLPVRSGDAHAPWLLAPPECVQAFRAMQCAGRPIGESGLTVRRGAMTALNDVLVLATVEPRLGTILQVRSEGHRKADAAQRRTYQALLDADCVRPCLRGTDVKSWHYDVRRHVVWSPRNDQPRATLPRRLQRYLLAHEALLRARRADGGVLQRLSPRIASAKVLWADVATSLRACAVPAAARTKWGTEAPIIPLNTVYFIPTAHDDDALLLAAFLNSLPCRVFARALAERAKDAHFRFFAWTVALLPLPAHWRDGRQSASLLALSRAAHTQGGITAEQQRELDRLAASAFGLNDEQVAAMRHFDDWLAGDTVEAP